MRVVAKCLIPSFLLLLPLTGLQLAVALR